MSARFLSHPSVRAALAGALVVQCVAGCATAWRGHSETIVIESDPVGASVRLSNGFTGRTPATFFIPRTGDLGITVEKKGYEPISILLKPTVGGGAIVTMTAGNSVVAAGSGMVVVSAVALEAGGLTVPAAAAIATPMAAFMGGAMVGGVFIDLDSGAFLSHGSRPIRFVLTPKASAAASPPPPASSP